MAWSPNKESFQPPKEWNATGTGMGTFTPTIPTSMSCANARAVSPSRVKMAVPFASSGKTKVTEIELRFMIDLRRRCFPVKHAREVRHPKIIPQSADDTLAHRHNARHTLIAADGKCG